MRRTIGVVTLAIAAVAALALFVGGQLGDAPVALSALAATRSPTGRCVPSQT